MRCPHCKANEVHKIYKHQYVCVVCGKDYTYGHKIFNPRFLADHRQVVICGDKGDTLL